MKISKRFTAITLKKKLLIYFVLVSFIPAALISVYNYASAVKAIENDIGRYNDTVLTNLLGQAEKQIEQINYFTEGLLLNQEIIALLRRSPEEASIEDEKWLKVFLDLEEQFRYTSVASYMLALLIVGDNGFVNRNGPYALHYDVGKLKNSEWFEQSKTNRKTLMLFPPIPNEAKASGEPYVIPVVRTINDINLRDRSGSLMIMLSEKFFGEMVAGNFSEGEEIYVIDRDGYILTSNRKEYIGTRLEDRPFMKSDDFGSEPYFTVTESGMTVLVIHRKSAATGLEIIKIVPMNTIERQKQNLLFTTLLLLFGTICIVYLLSLFLTGNLTRPVKELIVRVKRIATGDFDQPMIHHANDELGVLSKHIEEMAAQIRNHIEDKMQKQEERRKLEIRMLQSQINPHFLHNTLSSIKWMASMQQAVGIEEMAGSLGKLLRFTLGDLREKTLLSEELKILDEYFNIQRIRYKGKIKFEKQVADERLLHCSVLRFTLQPLVENAIFHGIEPKQGIGIIRINVRSEKESLLIQVWDNGVGMDQSTIDAIYSRCCGARQEPQGESIGLMNVFQRIRLVYGENYGLEIASESGKFTEVTVKLPIEYDS